MVVAVFGITAYRHNQALKQEELVDALVTVAGTAPLSDPSVMEDFEAIRQMSQADDSLLALSDDLMSLKQ